MIWAGLLFRDNNNFRVFVDLDRMQSANANASAAGPVGHYYPIITEK